MNPRDQILQTVTPTLMVPRFEELPAMTQLGHRFLIAKDGVWVEIKREWLHARLPICLSPIAIPYGELTEFTRFSFQFPESLVDAFVDRAKTRMPNECAAWVIWSQHRNEFSLRMLKEISATPASVTFHRPDLAEGEHLVLDLHSHGSLMAYFSATDNRDDSTEVKIAGVVGSLNEPTPSFAFRLCLLGKYVAIPFRNPDPLDHRQWYDTLPPDLQALYEDLAT